MTRCRRILALTSAFLDGELAAAARRGVQDHLRRCPACTARYRHQQRFQRRVAGAGWLALPDADRGLPDAVLASVAQRRSEAVRALSHRAPRRRALTAVALATAFGLTWLAGYRIGSTPVDPIAPPASPEPSPPPAPALAVTQPQRLRPLEPDALATFRTADIHPEAFVRAMRGLLADLELLDHIPPEARQPLLAVQLRHFDIASRAERVVALSGGRDRPDEPVAERLVELALFARRLAGAVDHGEDLGRLREVARAQDWVNGPEPGRGPALVVQSRPADLEPPAAAVAALAAGLPAADRTRLVDLLSLRDGWVRGQVDAGLLRRFADAQSGPFALPTRLTAVWTFAEAGDRADAQRAAREFEVLWQESDTAGAGRTFTSVHVSAGASASAGDPEAIRRLLRLFEGAGR